MVNGKFLNSTLSKDIKYNLKKDFPEEGVLFVDFMPTFMDMDLMAKLSYDISDVLEALSIDYVIAPESRGFILGTLVALRLGANLIPVRKHGKLPEEFISCSQTYNTEYSVATLDLPKCNLEGKNCIFIDDVYALGGTYNACKSLVESSGGKMLGGACLYDVGINKNDEIITYLTREDIDKHIIE